MKTREDKIYSFFGHLVMTILTLLAIIPILLMFISSLTDNATLLQNGYSFLPEKWSTYAYEWVFTSSSSMVIKAYGMSFILTATGVVCSLALTTCLAYGLSKKGLPGRNVLTFLVFFTMLFNGGLVPTYINYTTVFHVKDTFFGLLVPSLMMSAFNVLLMKSYFVTGVPDEILEAAYIDGANEFQTMWKIAIPLSKPIITTVAMFSGIAYWNDWNNGYIYLTKRTDLYSIQNLLNRLMQNIQALTQNANNMAQAGEGLSQIPSGTVRMAMAALGILPIMIIYPFIQKNFVKGITLGINGVQAVDHKMRCDLLLQVKRLQLLTGELFFVILNFQIIDLLDHIVESGRHFPEFIEHSVVGDTHLEISAAELLQRMRQHVNRVKNPAVQGGRQKQPDYEQTERNNKGNDIKVCLIFGIFRILQKQGQRQRCFLQFM